MITWVVDHGVGLLAKRREFEPRHPRENVLVMMSRTLGKSLLYV